MNEAFDRNTDERLGEVVSRARLSIDWAGVSRSTEERKSSFLYTQFLVRNMAINPSL